MRRRLAILLAQFALTAGLAADGDLVTIRSLTRQATPSPPPFGIQRDSFTLDSRVAGNPQVTCYMVWPVTSDGHQPARQGDLVLYLQHPKERFFDPPQGDWDFRLFEHLASDSGFTVCGVFFEHQGEEEIDTMHDRQVSYLFPESGSYQVLLSAVAEVRRRRNLDGRPILAIGNSGGAYLAQRLVEFAPSTFLAAADMGGAMFMSNDGHAAEMVINTLGDVATSDNDLLARLLCLRQLPTARVLTMPEWGRRGRTGDLFFHCIDVQGQQLCMRFLEGVSDLRPRSGTLTPLSAWPFLGDPTDQAIVYQGGRSCLQRHFSSRQPVALPSANAALAWMARPYLPSVLSARLRMARPSPLTPPHATVLMRWEDARPLADEALKDPSLTIYDRTDWDLIALADGGCIALRDMDRRLSLHFDLAVLNRSRRDARGLPVVLVLAEPKAAQLPSVEECAVITELVVVQDANRPCLGLAEALAKLSSSGLHIQVLAIADGPQTTSTLDGFADGHADGTLRAGAVTVLHRDGHPPSFDHQLVVNAVLALAQTVAAVAAPEAPASAAP